MSTLTAPLQDQTIIEFDVRTDEMLVNKGLLSEDWVGHPLRKDYDFPLEYHGIRGRKDTGDS